MALGAVEEKTGGATSASAAGKVAARGAVEGDGGAITVAGDNNDEDKEVFSNDNEDKGEDNVSK